VRRQSRTAIVGIGLVLVSIVATAGTGLAQQQPDRPGIVERLRRFVRRNPGDTPSGRQRGGGTLDQCPYVEESLLAVVPPQEQATLTVDGSGVPVNQPYLTFLERTTVAQPGFWFYVPYDASSGRQAEFVLIDKDETILVEQRLALAETPGLMRVALPKDVALMPMARYRWVFSVICNPANRSADLTVNGWVQRVPMSPALQAAIAAAPAIEHPVLYADHQFWYDTVDSLAQLRAAHPNHPDIQTDWQHLLEFVGLRQDATTATRTTTP
jgi:hypothetical protein